MAKYFDKFPALTYKVGTSTILLTNILFRVKVVSNLLKNNIFSYVDYLIPDSDTIEVTAEKYYGDPEAHWLICLANNYTDPLYDWPLNYQDFNNYLIAKYGSVEDAQNLIHHYELIKTYVTGQPPKENVVTIIIDKDTFDSTPAYSFQAFNFPDGITTVDEIITTNTVYSWDFENAANEAKRTIKLIKNDYYGQIKQEFQTLTESSKPTKPFIRSLKGF